MTEERGWLKVAMESWTCRTIMATQGRPEPRIGYAGDFSVWNLAKTKGNDSKKDAGPGREVGEWRGEYR